MPDTSILGLPEGSGFDGAEWFPYGKAGTPNTNARMSSAQMVSYVAAHHADLRGLTFVSETGSTADSDPTNGLFKWDNATQGSATQLFFDAQTKDAIAMATFIASLPASGLIYLQQSDDPTRWQLWKWTSAIVDGSGYYKFPVTVQMIGGTIQDNKDVYVDFVPMGGTGSGVVAYEFKDISNNATTLILTDAGKMLQSNALDTSPALTFPPNADVAFPVGTVIGVMVVNAMKHVITPGSGVTINAPTGRTIQPRGTGSICFYYKRATNTWESFGDLTSSTLEGQLTVAAHGSPTETMTETFHNQWMRFADGQPNQTVTFPSDANGTARIGTVLRFVLTSSFADGNLNFAQGSGATLNYDSKRYLPKITRFGGYAIAVKSAANTWDLWGDLDTTGYLEFNNQNGTAYTAVLADTGKKIRMDNASANAVTIQPFATVAHPIGCTIIVRQVGTGKTTITPGSGVTFNVPTGYTAAAARQGSEMMIHKVATNTWDVTGDLST